MTAIDGEKREEIEWTLSGRLGKRDGKGLLIKVFGRPLELGHREDATREFRVAAGWTHAAVKLSDDHGLHRLFLLEAADREDSYAHGALFVRGRYRLVEKVNNPTQASVRWKALGRGD